MTTANYKTQLVKVYDQSGHFLDVWRDAPLLGLDSQSQGPKFAINNITSQITMNLPRKFDNFDEGGDERGRQTITAGNVVKVYVFDNNTLTQGRLVFRGYIDGYVPQIATDGTEQVQVLLTPFDAVLGDVKYIGTTSFGNQGLATTYVDTMYMFMWPFGPTIAATSATPVTATVTASIVVTNTTNMVVGAPIYLRGTGADSAKSNGPLNIQSIVGTTITFVLPIPVNSYSNPIIVSGIAPTYSTTAVTGGVTNSIVVNSVTGMNNNMVLTLTGTGADVAKQETARILSIVGFTVTFTAPLTNSYSATIGVHLPLSFNIVTLQPITYPLVLDPTNPTTTGNVYQNQLHNQAINDFFETTRNLSPTGWFWRVNPDLTVTINQAATTPKHTFIIGQNVSQPQYQKNFSNLKNHVFVQGTTVTGEAFGSDISVYGERVLVIVEPRIIDSATAQQFANSTLAQVDRIDYRSDLIIVDNRGDTSGYGYDIETITVGDTCRISNPSFNELATLWDFATWDVDSWDFPPTAFINQTVVVSALTYNFDSVEVELSSLQPSQDKFLIDLSLQFENSQFT